MPLTFNACSYGGVNMICNKCGQENQESWTFCQKCGADLQVNVKTKSQQDPFVRKLSSAILILFIITSLSFIFVFLYLMYDNEKEGFVFENTEDTQLSQNQQAAWTYSLNQNRTLQPEEQSIISTDDFAVIEDNIDFQVDAQQTGENQNPEDNDAQEQSRETDNNIEATNNTPSQNRNQERSHTSAQSQSRTQQSSSESREREASQTTSTATSSTARNNQQNPTPSTQPNTPQVPSTPQVNSNHPPQEPAQIAAEATPKIYRIHTGSFRNHIYAQENINDLQSMGIPATIERYGQYYRVYTTNKYSLEEANGLLEKIDEFGLAAQIRVEE